MDHFTEAFRVSPITGCAGEGLEDAGLYDSRGARFEEKGHPPNLHSLPKVLLHHHPRQRPLLQRCRRRRRAGGADGYSDPSQHLDEAAVDPAGSRC